MIKTLMAAAVAAGLVLSGSPVVTTGALLDETPNKDKRLWCAERDASGRTAAIEPFRTGERVLFYGDSITHGGKYVCYLQLFENLRHPGSGVRLLNGGRSGGTVRTGLVNFDRELKASRPDRAFVMFGMNDIGVANRAKALEGYRANVSNLVSRFTAAGVTPVLMTPTPYDEYNLKAGANTPTRNEGLASAAEIVRRTAKGHNLGTVDFHAPMTKLFRESAEDFVFCRDRVHPGNEGHLYMAALVLDAMGVSPEVDGVALKARAGEGRVVFDYAPKALPLPQMPEYETLEAFYPLTERLNREIVRVAGLKPGRYTLAFDGRPVGDYSDEELAKGVNVALLDTPNQRRAQALVPVMRKLQTVLAQYRNVILVIRMVEDAKVDPMDFAAADAWLDKWLDGQKKSPWYRGVKAWVDGYRAGRERIAETEAEIESLYVQLAAVRPMSSRVTVDAIRIGGTAEVCVTASATEERTLPNLSSMACAWDGRRLKWTPNDRHPITNFVRYVELMTATGGNADRDMGEDFAPLVDLCRKALAYGLKPYLKLGNVPVRFTAGCDPRRKKQGGADGGSYGFNIRPPDDYEAYGRYMRSCAAALRRAFGLDEVRSWRFSVMTESNNPGEKGDSGWFAAKGGNAATLEAFVRLYDVTAKAFEAELGKGLVFGTHLLDPGEERRSFGYEDVLARCRPLRLLPISYYFGAPNGDKAGEAAVFDGLRDVLRAAGDGVISGIDEGRICFSRPGVKSKDLRTRTVGQSYQAAFNVRLAKTVFDAGGDYIASWGFFAGEDPLFAGVPTFDYFTAREIAKFAGMRRCAVRTDGAVPEKEVVDAIAAVSSDGRTVRVAVSRLRDRLEFADSFDTTVRIVLPAALRAAGRLSVSELTLDDRNNWFLDWERERREKGVTDKDYWASPDDPNPLFILDDDSAKAFFRSRMSAYAAKAERVVPQVRSVVVPQDGVVSLPVAFRGNGAAFIELRGASVAAEWERKGRAEALEWFSAHQFGRTPIGRTPDETFGPTYVSFPGLGLRIDVSCHLPEGASAEHPVPVFLFGDHVDIPSTPDFQRGVYKGLPIGEITSRGYAFVRWNFNDVCPNASAYNKPGLWPIGIIAKLATGDEKATNVVRQADSWGTIGAWAWGNSRVLDWIESRPELNARKVAVVGHSRGGKTALWTAAQDTRFAMAVANGSGCGGAGLARERVKHEGSERFKNILGTFPNWFCPAFTEWIGREAEVPHDSDDLIRLVAPRLVYVASGDRDTWACPASEKAAVDAARDIYRAYGAEDRMGYHCHKGPHKLHAEDWAKFMDFAAVRRSERK